MAEDNPGKILFVIPSLAGGGAERAFLNILNHIDRKRFHPLVVTFGPENDYPGRFPDGIENICLYKGNALDFFRLLYKLCVIIGAYKPGLVVSFLDYANYLSILAVKFSRGNPRVVISEQNSISKSLSSARFGPIKKLIIKRLYPEASAVVAVSGGVKGDLCENYNVNPARCRVIFNSADIERISREASEDIDHPWFREDIPVIIACGRLAPGKNYPLLLNSVKRVLKETDARLLVLGAGGDESGLKSLTKELGIGKSVFFAGFRRNPYKYMAGADIFVLSSLWEGFGNVIVEAMACGVPVISTLCPYGPGEIITDGVNGLLIPSGDENAMVRALLRLLRDEPLRKRLSEAGRRRAEHFSVERMAAEYQRVFVEGN